MSLCKTMNSYLGILSHANVYGLSEKVVRDAVLGLMLERLVVF